MNNWSGILSALGMGALVGGIIESFHSGDHIDDMVIEKNIGIMERDVYEQHAQIHLSELNPKTQSILRKYLVEPQYYRGKEFYKELDDLCVILPKEVDITRASLQLKEAIIEVIGNMIPGDGIKYFLEFKRELGVMLSSTELRILRA